MKRYIAILLVICLMVTSASLVFASETSEKHEISVDDISQETTEEVMLETADEITQETTEERAQENADETAQEVTEETVQETAEEEETQTIEESEGESLEGVAEEQASPLSGKIGEHATYTITGSGSNLTMTVSGTGDTYSLYDFDYTVRIEDGEEVYEYTAPWKDHQKNIKKITVKDGITGIGPELFHNCASVTNVELPKSIETIGEGAFEGCRSLKTIVIPEKVTRIGGSTFFDCESLTSITIKGKIKEIGDFAFCQCNNLTSFTINVTGGAIGRDAFYFNEKMKSVTILEGAKSLGEECFMQCFAMKTVAIPNSMETIDATAFENTPIETVYYGGTKAKWTSKKFGKVFPANVKVIYNAKIFKDVPISHSFFQAVMWGSGKGIVAGYSDGTFLPNNKVTRGQVAMFLWRAAGKPEPATKGKPFKDVPTTHVYYKAILWANEKGIAKGFSDGTFKPGDPCTRGQIVTFLWRYKKQPAAKSGAKTFPDVPKTHTYYKAIMWASSYGITTGFSDGKFKPDDTCTRGQCVTFLYRMLK